MCTALAALQGVELERFGEPRLFPAQNASVAVMLSKIDMFEQFQARCARGWLFCRRLPLPCLHSTVACWCACATQRVRLAILASLPLLQETLYFGSGKAAEQTREFYQRPINVTGVAEGGGSSRVPARLPAALCAPSRVAWAG